MHEVVSSFPVWVRVTHWFNFLFLTMVARSGIGILAELPKLYWNADTRPGDEWLTFTRKKMPRDRVWCSTDEVETWSPWIALPGGHHFGLSRSWHFLGAVGWLLTGAVYVALLFASDEWRRLIPTSPAVFTNAWQVFWGYLHFHLSDPSPTGVTPFNALQQLVYFGVIFVLSPLMILTGLAQAPAVVARFPGLLRLFGNRQAARSLHFLGLVAFCLFLAGHLAMVCVHGFAREMDRMVLGVQSVNGSTLGLGLGLAIIAAVVLIHFAITWLSHKDPRRMQKRLNSLWIPLSRRFLHPLESVQSYPESRISPFFRVNGYPPLTVYPQAKGDDDSYERLLASGFEDYRLEISGLVRKPLSLSLADLRRFPKQEQVTMHHCVQGWSSIGKWGGVRLKSLLELCDPRPEAHYLAFYSFGMHEGTGRPFYECLNLWHARAPQTILAYELNDQSLPVQHGAPLRLRVETCLGYKMVKYLKRIELIEDYRKIGGGMGGVREDEQLFDMLSHM